MNQQLVNHILAYMDDDTARYAIALEGPWGSGKTRFCMQELTEALKVRNRFLYRVSLFGLTSEADIYDRLLMAVFRVDASPEDNRWQKALKRSSTALAEVGKLFVEGKLKDNGFTVHLSSQMLTVLLGSDHLIVMDDVERLDIKKLSDWSLFGVINDLVEGQGCKVMLVSNDMESIPTKVREKLIWKQYHFEPDPAELADAVLTFADKPRIPNVDIDECIREAARQAHCINARAMTKARPLIEKTFAAPALSNEIIYDVSRRNALIDFIKYALMKASGTEPTEPKGELARFTRTPGLGQYKRLTTIESYFSSESDVSRSAVAEDIQNYIAAEYPQSQDTIRLIRLLNESHGFASMDDEDVRRLATDISNCILHSPFDFGLLEDVIEFNSQLRELGFTEALEDEQLFMRAKELIDDNPMEAYDVVHKEFELWNRPLVSEDDSIMLGLEMRKTSQLMFKVDEYIVKAYERVLFERVFGDIDVSASNSGTQFAERSNVNPDEGYLTFLAVPPAMIASSFVHSDGPSQERLSQFFKKVDYLQQSDPHNRTKSQSEALAKWLCDASIEFSGLDPKTLMGGYRLDGIRQILRPYQRPLQTQPDVVPTPADYSTE